MEIFFMFVCLLFETVQFHVYLFKRLGGKKYKHEHLHLLHNV